MASEVENHDPIERLDRFQALQSGQYWRAREALVEQGIAQGEVLLLESIRWVDDRPHTLILRPHPEKLGKTFSVQDTDSSGRGITRIHTYREHRFLLDDFLRLFEYEPDAERIREAEVRTIQQKVTSLQQELLGFQADPHMAAKVVQAALTKAPEAGTQVVPLPPPGEAQALVQVATGSVANAIEHGVTEAQVACLKQAAQREHEVATIKANWIQAKTQQIAETLQAMAPFYAEQAAAALARTEDTRTYVKRLMSGLESLDLYVGKGVTVRTLATGPSAGTHEPLTVVQKKLFMDEELAVWADVDESFDFQSSAVFFEQLCANPGLRDQVFPAPRCVLVMATTRYYREYGDSWETEAKNAMNRRVFLLVRDGDNIYQVFSPVETHLTTARLFPSKTDQDAIFRGVDGTNINFESLAYTDRLAKHEAFALHYKRFLLLICGLDHRLKLFGEFYPGGQSFSFVSLAFQEKYLRFLHDEDGTGMLPAAQMYPPLDEWLVTKNAYLQAGSRVLCHWSVLINKTTAPGAFRLDSEARACRPFEIATVIKDGEDLVVRATVQGRTAAGLLKQFECKVFLSKTRPIIEGHLSYLVLDTVTPQALDWFIAGRRFRQHHLMYLQLFKAAQRYVMLERAAETGTRDTLRQALVAQLGSEALEPVIDQTVMTWRAAHRGAQLPGTAGGEPLSQKKRDALLQLALQLQGLGAVTAVGAALWAESQGSQPLRLSVTGSGQYALYLAPTELERDDRLEPHCWVRRVTISATSRGLAEKKAEWVVLPKYCAAEATLHNWPGAETWEGVSSSFSSFECKQQIFALMDRSAATLAKLSQPLDDASFAACLADISTLTSHLSEKGELVRQAAVAIPIGIYLPDQSKPALQFLCVGVPVAYQWLAQHAPSDTAKTKAQRAYCSHYADKGKAAQRFGGLKDHVAWTLGSMPAGSEVLFQGYLAKHGGFSRLTTGEGYDPLLASGYAAWRANTTAKACWIHSSFGGGDALCVDAMLGIARPADYAPQVVRVFKTGHASSIKYWADMAPVAYDNAALAQHADVGAGYSCQSYYFASEALAIKGIEALDGGAYRAVPCGSTESVPEGWRRWNLLK